MLIRSFFVSLGILISLSCLGQQKKIEVHVLRNIELLSALNNQISTEFLKDSIDDPYLFNTTRLMRLNYDHFKVYACHPAVLATKEMSERIGTGVYLLGLFYSDFPKAELQTPVSDVILEAVHPDKDSAIMLVTNYITVARQFYIDADFEKYFIENQFLYDMATDEVKKNLPNAGFIETMESYYGVAKQGWHIIPMPSFKSAWGLAWELGEREKTIYNIISPLQEQVTNGRHIISAGFNNANAIRNLSVHEFGHSFVNPLTAESRFAKDIHAYDSLYKPVPGQGQYSDWMTLFNEHVVRAGEIRIAIKMNQQEESVKLLGAYKNWMYLPFFLDQLSKYEKNRRRYQTFRDYLPVMIASLKDLKP